MKRLTTYVQEKLLIFPSQVNEKLVRFPSQVNEKLVINKKYKNVYTCSPKTFNALRTIIEQRYEEQGPGTEQDPINFNDVDVSRMTSFYNRKKENGIFENIKFKYIDVSDWNVSKVEDMSCVFYNCQKLESVGDLSNWNVSKVKNMNNMFFNCCNLKSVGDLSDWDVSSVEDMSFMFNGCTQLKSVGDLSDWDVSKVKNMINTFFTSAITNTPEWYRK